MRNEIFYEWIIEELDEHGASRRSVGNELDGLHYWGYAYVDFENFTIEPKYCSGDKVPKHVIKQVEKLKQLT